MKRLLITLWFAIIASFAFADELGDLLTQLPGSSYSEKAEIASEIAATDDPRALDILGNLRAGELFEDKDTGQIAIETKDGFVSAESGEPVEGNFKKIRVNNGLRNALDQIVAAAGFQSDNVNTRMEAARSAFDHPNADQIKELQGFEAEEPDANVKAMLGHAIAAATLTDVNASTEDKKAAIANLETMGNQARSALSPAANDPELADDYQSVISKIERSEKLWGIGQNLWYGVSLGSVLLLAAIGLSITFGVMGVINMAHGELIMIGAYCTFFVQSLIRAHAPWLFDYSLFIAIPLAFIISGGVGVLIERGIVRHLYGRPLETLLATWGVSLILQQAIRTIFGPNNREVGNPSWMSGSFELGHLTLTWNRVWILFFALFVFGAIQVFLRKSYFGLQIRAVTQNRAMAANMAIKTGKIDALAFGLGAGVAGLAGVALSQIDNVSPNLGQSYIIDSFMVVVFGGAGNLWGAFAGAFTLGIANKFMEPFAGAMLAKIIILVAIIIFIQRRPRGLFPERGRAAEA